MPLDGHSYLVAQGWSGGGSGLREGSIARPLAVPQKKTLSGLGKDRDDAFPFWDHLYTIATKAIKIKIHKDEDDCNPSASDPPNSPVRPIFSRTSTGILSNRRPVTGTPASSGTSTPSLVDTSSSSSSSGSCTNLVVRAKREAARRGLYSRFFRGPVLGPDIGAKDEDAIPPTSKDPKGLTDAVKNVSEPRVLGGDVTVVKDLEAGKVDKERQEKEETGKEKNEERNMRKKEDISTSVVQGTPHEQNRKRKRENPVENVYIRASEKKKKVVVVETQECTVNNMPRNDSQKRRKKRRKDVACDVDIEGSGGGNEQESKGQKETKEEKRRRKEEKRKRREHKEGKRRRKEAVG